MTDSSLRFHLGKAASAVPLVFFIIWAITICVAGAPSENGLILGAVIGLTLGMFLCKDRWSAYAEQVFTGMANRIASVTIVAWFWAGMFAQVLRQGGLVDGLVWLGGVSTRSPVSANSNSYIRSRMVRARLGGMNSTTSP